MQTDGRRRVFSGAFATHYPEYTAADDTIHPAYNQWETRFGRWSARLGLRFSF